MAMLLLGGCGQKTILTPAPGATPPVAPFGTHTRPDADELLELDPQAAPERSVELRKRSEVREEDPFDLPPE
ncbi:hypothetical protein G7A66_02760 [Altererythrobacter sp. SALINAS58]|nr:hypothetical protein [Alteripontixanthobacter muriae]NTZ42031.1 hypothetical protein [Alteripontixanthobacter muriae]